MRQESITVLLVGHDAQLPSKYVYTQNLVLLSALAREASVCCGQQLMQRLITGQSAQMSPAPGAQGTQQKGVEMGVGLYEPERKRTPKEHTSYVIN